MHFRNFLTMQYTYYYVSITNIDIILCVLYGIVYVYYYYELIVYSLIKIILNECSNFCVLTLNDKVFFFSLKMYNS